MNEPLVRWTLLNNLDFLSRSLDFPIAKKKGQEITSDFGRIDFILEDFREKELIVELETLLNNKNKLDQCFTQVLNYKNVKFADVTEYCILYASETNPIIQQRVQDFGRANEVLIRTYSLNEVKKLYAETVERLSLSFGLALPQPANYTICYLRWLNKILKPFLDTNRDILSIRELAAHFTSYKTTNFRCYLRLALDFEVIQTDGKQFSITEAGKEYINNFDITIHRSTNLSSVNLTNEQKKILLRIITNGKWTPHKVNIYWFLRFIEVTNGEWIPNFKEFDRMKLDLLNGLFGVSYKSRTMSEFLNFACNWCMELDLIERISSNSRYDRLYLTPLGIEINNIFSLDLQLKRNRLNLNFKYLE
jgi:hypothetical protein